MFAERELNQRQRRILRSAARLFQEKGYAGTTVRDLARAVGVQSGSLFYHFESKENILAAVIEWGVRDALERAGYALRGARGARERLLALSRAHLEALIGETAEAMAVTLYEWRSLPPEMRVEIVRLRDQYEALWQEVLEEAATEGLISPGDVALVRRFALGALNWTVQWYRPGAKLDIDELTRGFVGFLLNEK